MSEPEALAAAAARRWGLPEPELVRSGMNTLFAAGPDVMLRVGRPAFPPSVDAQWQASMSSIDVRIPRSLRDMSGPDGVVITAIERIHAEGVVDWEAVGGMVRRVHAVPVNRVHALPFCGDFAHWQIDASLAEVADLIDPTAMRAMRACLTQWTGWHDRARIQTVVCHGDVHPGNVLPTAAGPVLLDWDLRCLAPAAWDHAALMTWTERWGGDEGMYEAFADGYGRSLRGEWMAEALAELRLLVATLMRLRAVRKDPVARAEAERRLRSWRGDPTAPPWTPQ